MIISSKKLPFYYFAQGKIEFWLFTAMLSFKPPKDSLWMWIWRLWSLWIGKICGRASIMGKSCCYDRNLRDWWSYGRNLRQWWKLIWFSVAIPRHAFVNWFATTNRLATQDILILLKWGYKGDSLRLLQASYVWVFQKNLERSYEEVLIRKPEFEMVQTCWMGFAWSEGEKSGVV